MKNIEVINAFVSGAEKGKAGNLRIEGRYLINYDTILAQRVYDGEGGYHFVVNATKYSQSTTAIQNKLLVAIPERKILRTVVDIPMGASYLI